MMTDRNKWYVAIYSFFFGGDSNELDWSQSPDKDIRQPVIQ